MISGTDRVAGPFAGNGVQDDFTFEFKVFTAGDLLVVYTDDEGVEHTWVETTDYTVALNGDQDGDPGGVVTALVAPATGTRLTITSQVEPVQGLQLPNNGPWFPKQVETALDKLTIQDQQQRDQLNRSLKYPISDDAAGAELPTVDVRANKYLAFDSDGNPTAIALAGAGVLVVSSYIETLLNDTDAATARATLGATATGDSLFTAANAAAAAAILGSVPATLIDAKGDLIVGSAADTAARLAVGANGTVPVANSGSTAGLVYIAALGGLVLIGGKLTASTGSNALTVAIKTDAGNDPSATEPVYIAFRDTTVTAGGLSLVAVTAATSLVISNGSTLGLANSEYARVHIGVINNSGTAELFAWTAQVAAGLNMVYPVEQDLVTTTAEGGAGAADSNGTYYSTTARTSKAWRYAGFVEVQIGTSGAWSNAVALVQTYLPGVPRPGEVVQRRAAFSSSAGNTSSTSFTNTSCTLSITPKARANRLMVRGGCSQAYTAVGATNVTGYSTLRRDGTGLGAESIGIAHSSGGGGESLAGQSLDVQTLVAPQSVASTTFAVAHAVSNASSNVTTYNAYINVEEIQG